MWVTVVFGDNPDVHQQMNEQTKVLRSDSGTLLSNAKEQASDLCNNTDECQNVMLPARSHTQTLKKIFLMQLCAYKCYTTGDWKNFPE